MDLYSVRSQLNSGKNIYDLPMNVTYYARVSTDKYEQANSLKNQVDYFSGMIAQNPMWKLCDGYIDEGISGTSVNKRDSFLKMIRDAKNRKFDLIITKEISRFSRNTLDSIKYTQELLQSGVGVYFQSDNINTFYPDAELRLTIMSSIAQEEVRKLSERVKFGFKRSIESGRVLGNNAIWGYKKDDGRLVIDEEQAKIIKLIFEMYASKRIGIRAIGKELDALGYRSRNGNMFSFSTIKNIIANPKYKGYYCGNKTRTIDYRLKDRVNIKEEDWVMYKDEDNVPPIVSEEMWEQANRILKERGEKTKNHETAFQSRYTYSGKIFCAEHDTAYQRTLFKYKDTQKEAWQCKLYKNQGIAGCNSPTLYTNEINEVVKEAFDEFVINRTQIIDRMIKRYEIAMSDTDISNEIRKKEAEINKILLRKDKLLDLSVDGRIDNSEFAERNDALTELIDKIRGAISDLRLEKESVEQMRETVKGLNAAIAKKLAFDNSEESSKIINTALEKIVVHKTDDKNMVFIEIYFRFNTPLEVEVNRKNKSHPFVINDTYDKGGY